MTYFDREPDYEQYGYEAYILEDVSGPDKFPEIPESKWERFEVVELRNEGGDTVVTPFWSLGADLSTAAGEAHAVLKTNPEAFSKQITFLESIRHRWKEDQDENDGKTYYSLSLHGFDAEEEAYRELTKEEHENLQELVDTDGEITHHQTQIIKRFNRLVRQALDERPIEIENRIEEELND